MSNQLNKPLLVFKAILAGHEITLEKYRYKLMETTSHKKRLCIIMQSYDTITKIRDETHVGSEMTLDGFINVCNRISDEDILKMCGEVALNEIRKKTY